jgi:hypothetical protein
MGPAENSSEFAATLSDPVAVITDANPDELGSDVQKTLPTEVGTGPTWMSSIWNPA